MKEFGGPVLFLDRSDINTDEIIPAKYLTEVTKEALKPFLLEDLVMDGFDPNSDTVKNAKVIITRENFGCGSSREHAPWALEVNEIFIVLAEGYARIFRQNMFNCGMMAVELSKENIDSLFALSNAGIVNCDVNLKNRILKFSVDSDEKLALDFEISEFDEALVDAGGWVEYADKNY